MVGRYANRLRNSSFSVPPARALDKLPPGAQVFHVTPNENGGRDSLHGGMWGYSRAGWTLVDHQKHTIVFSLRDEAGTEGFPATVTTVATYTLSSNSVWTTSLKSTVSNGETPIMLSHHDYFNLDGYQDESLTAMNHTLKLASTSWIKTDGILVPTGDIETINPGSGMDFRSARQVGERIEQMKGRCGTGELFLSFQSSPAIGAGATVVCSLTFSANLLADPLYNRLHRLRQRLHLRHTS